MSNSKEFMAQIPASDRFEGSVSKVLGLTWNLDQDTLMVRCPKTVEKKLTKRTFLQTLARVFDPLGLVSPAVLPGKMIIQDLWKQNLEWDQDVPPDLVSHWKEIWDGFADVSFPRFVDFCPTAESEFHIFVDASSKAYTAAAYLRQKIGDHYKVHLLFSKSRLAPAKPKITIQDWNFLVL